MIEIPDETKRRRGTNVMCMLEDFRKDDLARLAFMVKCGVGAEINYANEPPSKYEKAHKFHIVTKKDILRARQTIQKLSVPWTLKQVQKVKDRILEQAENRRKYTLPI